MKKNIAIQIEQSVNVIDGLSEGLRFTREEQLFLCEHFEPVEMRKHEFLTQIGKTEKYLYFVEEGSLRYWIPDGEEREVTVRFAFAGDFAGVYHSLKSGSPSAYHLQALEHSRLWRIGGKDLMKIYNYSLNMNKTMRVFLEELSVCQDCRISYLLHLSPEYRYQWLMDNEKNVILSVVLKHIATYLGIAPQTLSRIRKFV